MVHVNFGLVEGMSNRKGNVFFLEDIIDGAKKAMHDVMRKNESKIRSNPRPQKEQLIHSQSQPSLFKT